jgi:hypothetical protein
LKKLRLAAIAVTLLLLLPTTARAGNEMLLKTGSSGLDVYQLQQRLLDLDYFSFKSTGSYGGMTRSAVMRFQEVNNIMADGTAGEETLRLLFSAAALRNPIRQEVEIPIGPAAQGTPSQYGTTLSWNEVSQLLKVGDTCKIIDLNTGKTFHLRRSGGTNHAEMEPVSSADGSALLDVFGGEANWSKRPVIAVIGSSNCAASLQGMPHGEDTVSGNNAEGGCCLYFSGSRSDILNLADVEHNANILIASGQS